ncbi:MAG: PfkB family carbohydrate kinase [Halobacteriales archaeon]
MPDVVSLGSVNVDLVARLTGTELAELSARHDWFPSPDETVAVEDVPGEIEAFVDRTLVGGKGANQSVAAARAGADTAFRGRVGRDQEAYGVLDTLAGRGVDVSGVEETDAETGKAYVFVEPSGENRIAIVEGANGAVDAAYVHRHREAILEADCLLLQNEIPAGPVEELLESLADAPDAPTVIVDPAPPVGAAPLLEYDSVDIVTPNAHEYEVLRAEIDAFEGTVVRTRGGQPALVRTPAEAFSVTPPDVTPVDTTGAGDVFGGYLAARLAAGEPLVGAVRVAAAAASLATTAEGAQKAIPTMGVVEDILE